MEMKLKQKVAAVVEGRGPEVNTVGEWEYMLFVGMGGSRRVNVDK